MRKEEHERGLKEGMREGMQKGMKEGMKESMKESMRATALRMLETGKYALEEISVISDLSLDEVKILQAKHNV